MHAALQLSLFTVSVSAENVDGPTPAARVTWNTTIPPQCVQTSVTVEFRTSSRGSVVVTNITTNTSQTEVIQTGLQCGTYYYINVVVTIIDVFLPLHCFPFFSMSSRPQRVFVGGKEIVCMRYNHSKVMVALSLHRYTHTSWSES